jgi:hypothetical protein
VISSAGVIGQRMTAFLEQGNSLVIATRNAALEPCATRACALRVLDRDRVALLLPRATSARAVANLEHNGEIAICASYPRDFRTIQLKGRCLGITPGTAEDVLAAEQQLHLFTEACAPFGNTRVETRNLWLFDGWRAEIRVTALYAQSPGPGAGARMVHGDE